MNLEEIKKLEKISMTWLSENLNKNKNNCLLGIYVILVSYSLIIFSSPMPVKITWVEWTSGIGLLLGGYMLINPIKSSIKNYKEASYAGITSICLVAFPLLHGILSGHTLVNIARDVFPVAYLLGIPFILLLSSNIKNNNTMKRIIISALVFVASITVVYSIYKISVICGSIDSFVKVMTMSFDQSVCATTAGTAGTAGTLQLCFLKLYDPAILFTSLWLTSWGIVLIIRSWMSSIMGIILCAIGGSMAYAFMILGLRAYAALYILSAIIICSVFIKNKGFYIRMGPVILIGVMLFWTKINMIFLLMKKKQLMLGSNGKSNEWNAVIKTIFHSLENLFIGIGWGGEFYNPIYLNNTRFTHSAISFFLLKSGLAGIFLLILVIGFLLVTSKKINSDQEISIGTTITLISCAPIIIIGILFEPTFKMLSYGLVYALFLISLPWKYTTNFGIGI